MGSMTKTKQDSSERLMNFLLGQVMAKTGGKANPHIVREMILERIKEPDGY